MNKVIGALEVIDEWCEQRVIQAIPDPNNPEVTLEIKPLDTILTMKVQFPGGRPFMVTVSGPVGREEAAEFFGKTLRYAVLSAEGSESVDLRAAK